MSMVMSDMALDAIHIYISTCIMSLQTSSRSMAVVIAPLELAIDYIHSM